MAKSGGGHNAKARLPTIFKTRVFEEIDRISGDPAAVRAAVASLRDGAALLQTAVERGAVEDDAERRAHLEAHWIGDPAQQEVLRRALVRAGELAIEHRVPLDTYFVFAGAKREIAVSWNERQVTMIVVTPFPDVPTGGDAAPHPRIEIFREDDC